MYKVAKYYLIPVGVETVRVPNGDLAMAGVEADLEWAGWSEPRVMKLEGEGILVLLGFSGSRLVLVGLGAEAEGELADLLPDGPPLPA